MSNPFRIIVERNWDHNNYKDWLIKNANISSDKILIVTSQTEKLKDIMQDITGYIEKHQIQYLIYNHTMLAGIDC